MNEPLDEPIPEPTLGRNPSPLDDERWLDEFEDRWQSSPPPDVAAFLDQIDDGSMTDRRGLLAELVRMDMEYRFRDASLPDKSIEAYRDEFPELPLTSDWVLDEARLRRRRDGGLDRAAWMMRFPPETFASRDDHQRFVTKLDVWIDEAAAASVAKNSSPPSVRRSSTNDDDDGSGQRTRIGGATHRWPLAGVAALDGVDPLNRVGPLDSEDSLAGRKSDDVATRVIDAWGQLRPRFRQENLLGEGSFGTVWRAFDVQLQRPVAIKTVRPSLTADPHQRDGLIREAQLAAQLDHPDLLTIHDILVSDDQIHVVMQWIDGRPLDQWFSQVAGGDYEPLAVLMARISLAVHHAHLAGLIHCDLKPQNILVDADGDPTVLDFGLAVRRTDQETLRGRIIGTPAYMSPEQTFGETNHLDGRADIWSLGAILYRLITGKLPFEASGIDRIFDAIQTRPLTPMGQVCEHVPEPLDAIVRRCLTKRVEDRFATAAELADHLHRFAQARSSITRSVSPAGTVVGLPWTQPGLIGRDRVIDDVTTAMTREEGRLITLTGGGGMGKTQTAATIARRIAAAGEFDVVWVELAAIDGTTTDVADQFAGAILAAMGVEQLSGASSTQRLTQTLAVRAPLVLVLDNVEQIVRVAASQVALWLGESPTLRVLVTSQTPLRIRGEDVRLLAPLRVDDDTEAFALLVRRARESRADLVWTNQTRADAIEICRLVDGNPLAIELAAARLTVLSVPELRERLGESFHVLHSNRADRPDRHRTLHNVVRWSVDLLSDPQRQGFLALSMWPVSISSELAERLLAELKLDALNLLDELVNRNLVRIRDVQGTMMVQTSAAIHRFALETISPAQSVEFSRALIRVALQADVSILKITDKRRSSQSLASNLFSASQSLGETDNELRLRAVLLADRLAGDLWDSQDRVARLTPMFPIARGTDQIRLGLRLVDAQRLAGHTGAALRLCGQIADRIGQLMAAGDVDALELRQLDVATRRLLARMLYRQGELNRAITVLEEALPVDDPAPPAMAAIPADFWDDPFAERPDVPSTPANTTSTPTTSTNEHDMLARWLDALLELIEIQRRAGHLAIARNQLSRAERWIAGRDAFAGATLRCKIQAGKIALQTGRVSAARQMFDDAVESCTAASDHRDLQQALLGRAAACAEMGDFEAAGNDYDRCEKLSRRLGDLPTLAQAINNQAIAYDDAGDGAKCIETLDRALAIYQQLGDSFGIAIALSAKASARLQMGDPEQTRRLLESADVRDVLPRESIHHAIALCDLGTASHRLGEFELAAGQLRESLRLLDRLGIDRSAERLLASIELCGVLAKIGDPSLAQQRGLTEQLVAEWPRQWRDRRRVAAALAEFGRSPASTDGSAERPSGGCDDHLNDAK